jgi:hypothetical protein
MESAAAGDADGSLDRESRTRHDMSNVLGSRNTEMFAARHNLKSRGQPCD